MISARQALRLTQLCKRCSAHPTLISTCMASTIFQQSKRTAMLPARSLLQPYKCCFSIESSQQPDVSMEEKVISPEHLITQDEKTKGDVVKNSFRAETKELLEIVAKSLYSDKHIFVRELISNASDALEKFRYSQLTGELSEELQSTPIEIRIATDLKWHTVTIQDTGIGMTKDELISNLGTIAKSGTKEFLKHLKNQATFDSKQMIGQFGVGFYSSFMVADKVEVFTQSYKPEEQGYKWVTDGSSDYKIWACDGIPIGTKVVIHLKEDCHEFAKEDMVKDVVAKYSNFISYPIFLNGTQVNTMKPIWAMDPKSVSAEEHKTFYQHISKMFDEPRYTIHYRTESPLSINALIYIPQYKPTLMDFAHSQSGKESSNVALYSRRVLVMPKAKNILPEWLSFVYGVLDSEDLPLNLSREFMQDNALISKIRSVLTSKIVKFFADQAKKDDDKYSAFLHDFRLFIANGVVSTSEQDVKEEIASLLRFETSKMEAGKRVSLKQYVERMGAGSPVIYFLHAPNRHLAECSPYLESILKENQDREVLFVFEPFEEMVLLSLGQFQQKNIRSVDTEAYNADAEDKVPDSKDSLTQEQADKLTSWLKNTLDAKVDKVKLTNKLDKHPCIVTIVEMANARHFLKSQLMESTQEERLMLLKPTLEINPMHPIILKLNDLREQKPDIASLVAEQLLDNGLVTAGLIEDPRPMVERLNELLVKLI